MKQLMTGNEALARGAWEAGVHFASAYPGTPSTEIMENIACYPEISSEWAPNEKVALEAAYGASLAGGRGLAAMKHVGLNVAADALCTYAYMKINGGLVIITADEPGQHSSQNEQDNRHYARLAKVPMLEPSDSQECKDMVKLAFEISKAFDTPVLVRVTTRVCHSKGIVDCRQRQEVQICEYVKDVTRTINVPAMSRPMRVFVEQRLGRLAEYSETSPLNRIEWGSDRKIGVVASGLCCYYAKEVFGEGASYLKIGFSYPLPKKMIESFCGQVETVYVIEENDPLVEDAIKAMGFSPVGSDVLPFCGEMTPDVLRRSIFGKTNPTIEHSKEKLLARPPMLCAGCPHRGFFIELAKRKNVFVSGDIGCYTLAFAPPYNALDCNGCMGASISAGHGAQRIFSQKPGNKTRVVSVLGDSTFFHSGMTSLLDVTYNKTNPVTVILDNRITGMTGHQQNPGSGLTVVGVPSPEISIENIVRALGIEQVRTIDPNNLEAVGEALDWALELQEPSVIITRWPCVLKKFSEADRREFPGAFEQSYKVLPEACIGCRICLKAGCPAISFDYDGKKAVIDADTCVGCSVCAQLCPQAAIVIEEER